MASAMASSALPAASRVSHSLSSRHWYTLSVIDAKEYKKTIQEK
jgi:hypothetical protein